MALKQLAGQTLWYGLSNIVGRLIGAMLSPLLTYLLGDDATGMMNMGEHTILYAWIAVGNIIFTYGLETGYFRFIHKKDVHARTLFNTTFTSLLLTTILFVTGLIIFRIPLAEGLAIAGHEIFIIYMALILGLDTIATIPFAKLRSENRPKQYAFIKITGIIINIAFVLIFLYVVPTYFANSQSTIVQWILSQHKVGLILLANLIQNIVAVLLLSKAWIQVRFKIDFPLWKQIIAYSVPMIVIGLAGMINEVLDRQFLLYFLPLPEAEAKGQVGIYAANYKLAIFISLFIQAFRMGAEPFFFKEAANEDAPKTYALVMKWFAITLCLAFLVAALYLDIIGLVNKGDYRSGMGIVPIVLLANVFLGLYYNLSVWYKITDRMYWGIIITLIGAAITLGLNYLLVPIVGYWGAAWATLACYGTMTLLAYLIGQKYYPVPYAAGTISMYICIVVGMYLLQQWLKNAMSIPEGSATYWYSFISGTIGIGLFLLLVYYKEQLRLYVHKIPIINKLVSKRS